MRRERVLPLARLVLPGRRIRERDLALVGVGLAELLPVAEPILLETFLEELVRLPVQGEPGPG